MLRTEGPFFESLEPRTFLTSATIIQDMGRVAAAQTQLNGDQANCRKSLATDQANIRAATRQRGSSDPAVAKLKADTLDCRAQGIADRASIKTTRTTTRAAVVRDLSQVRVDKGNPAALAADKIQLATDKAKEINDTRLAEQTQKTNAENCRTLLANDRVAIVQSRQSNSAAVAAARQQLIADRGGCVQTIATDKQSLIAARLKLAQDRKAGV